MLREMTSNLLRLHLLLSEMLPTSYTHLDFISLHEDLRVGHCRLVSQFMSTQQAFDVCWKQDGQKHKRPSWLRRKQGCEDLSADVTVNWWRVGSSAVTSCHQCTSAVTWATVSQHLVLLGECFLENHVTAQENDEVRRDECF